MAKSVPNKATRDQVEAAYPMLLSFMNERRARQMCEDIYRTMIDASHEFKSAGMTDNQRRVHQFIADYIQDHEGVSPTFQEIGEFMDRKKSDIYRVVTSLEKKGILSRSGGHRGITLLIKPGQR